LPVGISTRIAASMSEVFCGYLQSPLPKRKPQGGVWIGLRWRPAKYLLFSSVIMSLYVYTLKKPEKKREKKRRSLSEHDSHFEVYYCVHKI
jgi:hypothetical protein